MLDEACELVADDLIAMLRLKSHVPDAELRDHIRHSLRQARPKKSVSVNTISFNVLSVFVNISSNMSDPAVVFSLENFCFSVV